MAKIEEFKVGETVIGFYMVRNADIRAKKNGDPYLDVELGDASGTIRAKKWDIQPGEKDLFESLKSGDIVKAKGKVSEYNGAKQFTLDRLRLATDADEYEKSDLFKAAPEPSEEMYDYIISVINGFGDEDLKKLCLSFYEENRERLMYYPAAMKLHHAEYGGLLYHIKRMLQLGDKMCEVYPILDRDVLLAGIALHDLEKMNEIESDTNGVSPGYSVRGQLLGHLVMGAVAVDKRCRELGIDEEKAMVIEHMMLSHHKEPEFGSPKMPMFPEAEALHYIDTIDARMMDYEDNMKGIEEGSMSDNIYSLEHRIYKRTF